ncbi:MAG: TIR domain-containing protein [Chloroflexi bacterium]|nr:TIR domain-containing protein [Chloroflexota bacterium]
MSDHVFISYKHTDGLLARLLTLELKAAGIDYWWDDHLKPGENWSASIDDQIRGALALILLISPESQKSEYVTYEWSFAIGAGVPVFPLVITKVEAIHPRLSSIQYVDVSGTSNPNFKPVLDQLLALQAKRAAAAKPVTVTVSDAETVTQMDRGRDEYRKRNTPRALQLYEQALSGARDSIKPDVCAQMAYILCKSGDLDRADKLVGDALALHPDFADALAVRGLSASLRARDASDDLQGSKLISDAQSSLLAALTPQPNLLDLDDESWWGTLGGVYKRAGNYGEAIRAYEHARGVTPESSYPLSNMALLYALDKQPDKMRQTYTIVERVGRKTVEQSPLDHWAYSDLILAELALGKYDEARSNLEELMAFLPDDVEGSVIGSLLEALKSLTAVVGAAEQAQLQPFVAQMQARVEALR